MRTKKVITGLAAAALATGVGVGAATASGSTGGSDDGQDSSKFTSSVTAPDDEANEVEGAKEGAGATKEGDDAAHEAADAAEQAALLKLAGVDVDAAAARAAALAEVPGTAHSVELGNEDGNVVWTVQVIDGAGMKTTVFVDAGTAKVLATKTHDRKDNDGPDGPETQDGADD